MINEENNKQEALLVNEEGNNQVNIVTGVNENGKLKTVSTNSKNSNQFLKLNKNGDLLDNFMSNFINQSKNPFHFNFFKVSIDNIEQNANVISEVLSKGDEGKEFLDDYRVDTSEYYLKKETTSNINPTMKDQEYHPIDEKDIDWNQLEKIGVTRDTLVKTKSLEAMLNYKKSPGLISIDANFEGISFKSQAKLAFKKDEDGKIKLAIHAIQKTPNLNKPFFGNYFTDEDKKNLTETGNLGRTIELKLKDDKTIPAFVSIDRLTNEVIALSTSKIRIPNEIKGVILNNEQKENLLSGKEIYVEDMTSKNDKKFNAAIQVNTEKRGLEFIFDNQQKYQKSSYKSTKDFIIPNKLGGIQLSENEISKLKDGNSVYVEGMKNKDGETYNAYIKINNGKGKLDFYKWDPEKKKISENKEQSEKNNQSKISNEKRKKNKAIKF